MQRALLPEIRDLLTTPEIEPGLRLLILQALKDSDLAPELTDILRALLLDKSAVFVNRREAGSRLAGIDQTQDWPKTVCALLAQESENGSRLAIEMLNEVGHESFDDALLIDVILSQVKRAERSVGVLHEFERLVSEVRLDAILDRLAKAATALGSRYERNGNRLLTDLAYSLVARRLNAGTVDARRLWNWLRPFASQIGYERESREGIARCLLANDDLRRAVQHHVLFELPGDETLWNRSWALSERTPGLSVSAADVVVLLGRLNPAEQGDGRWHDLVQLARHSDSEGREVREAALVFAAHRPDQLMWLEKLSEPSIQEWEIKQQQQDRDRIARRARRRAKDRAVLGKRIDEVRSGEFALIFHPAMAYLKLLDSEEESGEGSGRIADWLGDDLRNACLAGFEAFLKIGPEQPTATEVAEGFAEGKGWNAVYIIVAALAERLRSKLGFGDVPDDRLMAGLFELRHSRVDEHAGITGLQIALAETLRERGRWEAALRLYFEPQFAHRRPFVDGLSSLMREQDDAELAVALAAEWLTRYPDMPFEPEAELIDRLVRSGKRETLRAVGRQRSADESLSDERRRNWHAIAFIEDFEAAQPRLQALGRMEGELLWHIRAVGQRRS